MFVSHTEAAVNPFTLHSISIFHPMQTEDVGYGRIRAKLNINNLRSTSPRNQILVPKFPDLFLDFTLTMTFASHTQLLEIQSQTLGAIMILQLLKFFGFR